MPQVYVEVDAWEVLPDISTKDLEEELESRRRKIKGKDGREIEVHPWDLAGAADDLRTAFYARNAARFEAILAAFEPPTKLTASTVVATLPGSRQ